MRRLIRGTRMSPTSFFCYAGSSLLLPCVGCSEIEDQLHFLVRWRMISERAARYIYCLFPVSLSSKASQVIRNPFPFPILIVGFCRSLPRLRKGCAPIFITMPGLCHSRELLYVSLNSAHKHSLLEHRNAQRFGGAYREGENRQKLKTA